MRTLFLNPPSFEGFDGGAGSRWPASREIESYWYPVWLCYPAGMLEDSKVVDAPPHKITIDQTVAMANDFELLVLFTSSPGFHIDVKIAEMMKDVNSKMKVAFVGPPVTIEPEKSLIVSKAIVQDQLVRDTLGTLKSSFERKLPPMSRLSPVLRTFTGLVVAVSLSALLCLNLSAQTTISTGSI
jgi:hypothetical protein